MYQEKRLINISSDELKLYNNLFKAFYGFPRHSFRCIPPSSHQFVVHNGKAGVGGQVSCESHAANGWQNPSEEQSSTTVLSNPSSVNLYFKFFSGRLVLVEEYQAFD